MDKLATFIKISNGKHNTQDCKINGKYPFFDRSEIIKYSDNYLYDDKAVIIPGEGTNFQPRYYEGKFDLHQRCYCITSNSSSLMTKYLYYYLECHKEYFTRVATGSTVKSLRLAHFLDMPVMFHPLEIQSHIVNTIGSIDDLIENTNLKAAKILNILELSLLNYPKVSFEFYKPQIVKSGIKKYYNTKEYLDTSSVEGINNIIESNTVTYNTRPSRANMQPMVNSVWFAKMKDSNKVIIVTNRDEDLLSGYIFSTGFFGLQSNNSLPLSFLTAIVSSKSFKEQRDLNSVGTTMAGINNDTFMKILVPKLNKNELLRYDYIYSHYINQLSLYRRKIISLKQTKQLLLDKYF